MAGYLVANYTITQDAEYKEYPPGGRTDRAAEDARVGADQDVASTVAERPARMREAIFATQGDKVRLCEHPHAP